MATYKLHRFVVRGSWPFPVDMLRYDQCYPATETASAELANLSSRATGMGNVAIELESRQERSWKPMYRRWESRCWHVISHDQEP